MVRANRELLGQALANLVDNAIKYADEGSEEAGGRASRSAEENGRGRRFSVADNGAGIAEADRARVTRALRAAGGEPLEARRAASASASSRRWRNCMAASSSLGDNGPGLVGHPAPIPGAAAGRAA